MYENQIRQQSISLQPGAACGSSHDRQKAMEALMQGTGAAAAPRSPLGEAADALDQRLQHLQTTIYRLGDRLAPVVMPATPTAQEVGGIPTASGAPVVDAIAAASSALWSMQRQIDALIDRLAI